MDLKLLCLSAYIMAAIASVESNITFETGAGGHVKRTDKAIVTKNSIIISLKTTSGFNLRMVYHGMDIEFNFMGNMIECTAQIPGHRKMEITRSWNPYDGTKYSVPNLWISWNNGQIWCGIGIQKGSNTILYDDTFYLAEFGSFQYVKFTSKQAGIWTIIQPSDKLPAENQNNNFKKSMLVQKNVNIQSGVMWQQTAVNPGHCAFVCLSDDACLSYTYNSMKKVCRGHREKYQNLDDVTHSPEEWSEYYTYD